MVWFFIQHLSAGYSGKVLDKAVNVFLFYHPYFSRPLLPKIERVKDGL